MNLLKSFLVIFKEAIIETLEEGISKHSNNDENIIDDFSNSYRIDGDNYIITDFEGCNAPENGGQWLRKDN